MFNPRIRLLMFLALSLVAVPSLAQNDPLIPANSLEISGQIRLLNGGLPEQKILIRLSRFGGGLVEQTMTDSRGNFRFFGLTRGRYIVAIENPDYGAEPQQADIDQRAVRRAYVFLQLRPFEKNDTTPPLNPDPVLDARVPAGARKEYERGRGALSEKKFEKAITHFEKAVGIYPDFEAAHLLLGASYMNMQRWDKAEDALRRALRIKPDTIMALIDVGEACRRQKQYADAEEVLQAALKLNDNVWQAHYTLGRVYWETNQIAKAGQHTGRTLQLMPNLAEARLLAGNIFMRAGRPESAAIEYEEYLRLAPNGEFAALTRENVRKLKRALAEKKN